jgi:hypothetical protein
MQTRPQSTQFAPLAEQLGRLGGALVAAGGDVWTRSLEIGVRYARSAVAIAASSPADGARTASRAWLAEGRHLLTELAFVPWLALERAAEELGPHPRRGAAAPGMNTVQGKPVALPMRVLDAAQGTALYGVGVGDAQAVLDAHDVPFTAVDLGRGRTVLMIYAARFRNSDLGAYAEMGFALLVAPASHARAPGFHFFAMPVTSGFAGDAGRTIWGYAKTEEEVELDLQGHHLTCSLARQRGGRHVLRLVLPRGGHGASTAIPLRTYTMLDGRPCRTVVVRSGRGERWKAGGDGVQLTLGDARANADDPLWHALARLRVTEAEPILHGWTEHMAADFLPPERLASAAADQ